MSCMKRTRKSWSCASSLYLSMAPWGSFWTSAMACENLGSERPLARMGSPWIFESSSSVTHSDDCESLDPESLSASWTSLRRRPASPFDASPAPGGGCCLGRMSSRSAVAFMPSTADVLPPMLAVAFLDVADERKPFFRPVLPEPLAFLVAPGAGGAPVTASRPPPGLASAVPACVAASTLTRSSSRGGGGSTMRFGLGASSGGGGSSTRAGVGTCSCGGISSSSKGGRGAS
mmetsp:Transcript_2509/g.7501  ORF Transcript_2509/g.7501 Transcript_2509/m.7501 type:complete len:232 (+) Transcript_2509:375-1070(+)